MLNKRCAWFNKSTGQVETTLLYYFIVVLLGRTNREGFVLSAGTAFATRAPEGRIGVEEACAGPTHSSVGPSAGLGRNICPARRAARPQALLFGLGVLQRHITPAGPPERIFSPQWGLQRVPFPLLLAPGWSPTCTQTEGEAMMTRTRSGNRPAKELAPQRCLKERIGGLVG